MFTDCVIHGYNKNGIPIISAHELTCFKKKYPNCISAKRELAYLKQKGRKECRVYYCRLCGYWHITSQEKRSK